MTQAQLLPSLNLNDNIYNKGNFLVVHQRGEISADFLLHFLISDFNRRFGSSSRILLILNRTCISRWVSISSRLGYNLQLLKDKGCVQIVDLMQLSYETIVSRASSLELQSQQETASIHHFSNDIINPSNGDIHLNALIKDVEDKIGLLLSSEGTVRIGENGKQSKKILILTEDLSDLYQTQHVPLLDYADLSSSQGVKDKNILEFLRKLRNLSLNTQHSEISFLTLVKSKGVDDTFDRFSKLVSQVLGSLVFEVSPLSTGVSANISGFLNVKYQQCSRYNQSVPVERHWSKNHHYKLEDRSIKITPL